MVIGFLALVATIIGIVIALRQGQPAQSTTGDTVVTEVTQAATPDAQANRVEAADVQPSESVTTDQNAKAPISQAPQPNPPQVEAGVRPEPYPTTARIAEAVPQAPAIRQPPIAARAAFLTGSWSASGEGCDHALDFSINGNTLELNEANGALWRSYRIVDVVGGNSAVLGNGGRFIREGSMLRYEQGSRSTRYEAC